MALNPIYLDLVSLSQYRRVFTLRVHSIKKVIWVLLRTGVLRFGDLQHAILAIFHISLCKEKFLFIHIISLIS